MPTAVSIVVGLGLAGCAGGSGSGTGSGSAAVSVPASSPAADPTTAAGSGAPASAASSSGGGATSSSPYLAVLPYVSLTPPGTVVDLGEPVVAAWTPRLDTTGAVRVSVESVRRTTVAKALREFALSRVQRLSTPYFVRVSVANLGPDDLSGMVLPIYLRDTDGDLVESTGVADTYRPCSPHALPSPFAAGQHTEMCLIFLAPRGTTYDEVQFVPPVGVEPIGWSGRPTGRRS